MKQLSIFILIVLAVFGVSCSRQDARQRLMAEIEASNRLCPQSLGPSGSLRSVQYDQDINVVIMHYVMNPLLANRMTVAGADDSQKREMARYLRDPENRGLLDLFNEAGASLTLSFTFGTDSTPLVLTLSSDEIHAIAEQADSRENDRQEIQQIVESEDRLCPTDLGNGVTATAVTIESNFMTYTVTVPDSISLSTSEARDHFRTNIIAGLTQAVADTQTASTLRLLKSMEYGIRYRINSPADSITVLVDITPEEIADIPVASPDI